MYPRYGDAACASAGWSGGRAHSLMGLEHHGPLRCACCPCSNRKVYFSCGMMVPYQKRAQKEPNWMSDVDGSERALALI